MTEQVENKYKDFMEDIGFRSIGGLYELLDWIYFEMSDVLSSFNQDFGVDDERRDLIEVPMSSIRNIKTIVYCAKEGYVYPFLLEPTVLWLLSPAIAQVKEDLDCSIKTVDNEEIVKRLKKIRKKVEKLIKRICPGVVNHCIQDSFAFLIEFLEMNKCGPECGNHDREEGGAA